MTTKPGAIIIDGHVQGLANTRALGREGIPVVIVDKGKKCLARYSKYCRAFYHCPEYQSDELADFLIALSIKHGMINWIVLPSNDHAVHTLARNKGRLSPYLKIITESLATIEKIINKDRFLDLARSIGVAFPKTRYLRSSNDPQVKELNYPVLTKGKNGLTFFKKCRKKAFLAENESQLLEQLLQLNKSVPIGETFTQELVPDDGQNKTESFTAFSIKGEIKAHWTGVKLREHPLRFGTATFCKSVDGSHLLPHGAKILRALDYTGVCEIEFIKDPRDNEYKLIEMNARTWLWVGLAINCGVNYSLMIYEYFNNDSMKTFPSDYRKDKYWRNLLVDVPYALQGMLLKKVSLKDLLPKKKTVSAIFNLNDPCPFLRFLTLVFFLKKERT
ncbi:MAG: hypothetical protein JW786_12530 [Desulfobacterales bacterium]|nr:hypothetical protein [Desulfobacterales bacterium]